MMMGAVAPKTAEMLAEAGSELFKRIETQNQQFDAQMKGPEVGALYADSLQKVARGDFSGFSGIAKASAMSSTNPFLAAAFKDMDTIGARLADSHLDRAAADARILASDERQAARIDAQERMQTERLTAADAAATNRMNAGYDRQDEIYKRQIEREDEQLYRQDLENWDSKNNQATKDYEKELDRITKANEGEKHRASLEEGYQPKLQEPPPKPTFDPKPERRTRTQVPRGTPDLGLEGNGNVFPQGDGGVLPSITSDVPLPAIPDMPQGQGDVDEGGIVNDTPVDADGLPTDIDPGAVSTPAPPPGKVKMQETGPDVTGPRPPRMNGKVLDAPLGTMTFHVLTSDKPEITISEGMANAGGGTTTITTKSNNEKDKKAARLAELIGEINSLDYNFANEASLAMMKKQPVNVQNFGTDKEPKWYAQVAGKNMQTQNPAYKGDPNAPQTTDREPISGEVAKRWTEAQGLVNQLKGSLSITYKVPTWMKQRALEADLADIAKGDLTLKEVNSARKEYGSEVIKPEQVAQYANEKKLTLPQDTQKVISQMMEEDKIKSPAEVMAEKTKKQSITVLKNNIKDTEAEINSLKEKYQTALAKGEGLNATPIYDELVEAKKKLNSWHNELRQRFPEAAQQ